MNIKKALLISEGLFICGNPYTVPIRDTYPKTRA